MKQKSGFKFLILFTSTFFVVSCSCSQTDVPTPSLSFTQESLTINNGQSVDVSTLLNYENLVSDVTYEITNNEVLSLDGSTVTALSIGECTVKAIYNEISDSLLVKVTSDKPNIEYKSTNFEHDISSGDFVLSSLITVTPSNASLELTSTREDYVFNNGKIALNGTGDYIFSLKAKLGEEYSSAYNFTIYAYDVLKLSGRGTVSDPYLIRSSSDLKKLSDEVLNYKDLKDKYFLQTTDIDISEYDNWTPIGTFGVPFEGIYNGNNKEVTGLKIETHESWQGLFGFSSGTIKNLTVRGEVKVSCHPDYVYSHSFAAGICGGLYNAALVDNCINYVNVHGDSYVGGIVGGIARSDEMIEGRNQSKIINCKNYGTITGDDTYAINENAMYFGGICGESLGILTGNTNYGEVKVTGEKTRYVGGVCGLGYIVYKYGMYYDEDLEIYANNDNINRGKVTGYHSVGGVFGANVLPSHRCINYGEVNGYVCVGGVSGLNGTSAVKENDNSISLLEDCQNYGKVYAELRYSGGVASTTYFDVTNCQNYGVVTGGPTVYYVGGVVGNQVYGNVSNCENKEEGIITGYHSVGGVIGFSTTNSISITNCINRGSISILPGSDTNAVHIGGIAGLLGTNNTLKDCKNYGSVTGTGSRNSPDRWGGTGGITGSIYKSSKIFSSENYGHITGNQQVGGIFGYADGNLLTAVQYCSNSGTISSTHNDPHLGGIAGRINGTSLVGNTNTGTIDVPSGATNANDIYGSASASSVDGNRVSGDGYSPYFYLFSGGMGKEDDPFLISNTYDFELFRERMASDDQKDIYYKLIDDIVVTGVAPASSSFAGVFDGDGHSITLDLDGNRGNLGLFANNTGTIKNVTMKGNIKGGASIAALVLNNNGLVDNCINEANVTGTSRVGGLVSNNSGIIINSINRGNVSGSSQYIGGVAAVNGGASASGTIRNCVNKGNVSSTSQTSLYNSNGNCVGGITGFTYSTAETVIESCYNYGTIRGISALGGITGFAKTGSVLTFNDLYNFGDVIGEPGTDNAQYCGHIGGIVGMLGTDVSLTRCYNSGSVTGNGGILSNYYRGVGGIAGSFYSGSITYSFSSGTITSSMNGGGICGYSQNNNTKTISNCVVSSTITEGSNCGGIMGRGNITTITNCISFAKCSSDSYLIIAKGNSVTLTDNTTFTEQDKMNEIFDTAIKAFSVETISEATTLLSLLNSLLAQVNTTDTSILNTNYDTDHTILSYINSAKDRLETIINGGAL